MVPIGKKPAPVPCSNVETNQSSPKIDPFSFLFKVSYWIIGILLLSFYIKIIDFFENGVKLQEGSKVR